MTAITNPASLGAIQRYIELLFPDAPDDAWLVVSWLHAPRDFRSRWFLMADHFDAIKFIADASQFHNTYVALGLRNPQCHDTDGKRGKIEDVFALGGLWIELDHNAGIHSAKNLPSEQDLQRFIAELPFSFSLTINSGGGIHGYLLFKELWILDTSEERERAVSLLRRFQRTIQLRAAEQGWHVDSTADLARVLRPLGTWNYKSDTPRPVELLDERPIRYNPTDISEEAWLVTIEDMYTPAPHNENNGGFPPAILKPIGQGCAWLRHCLDDAKTLPEPEWYAMLGIVARCKDGAEIAHQWSLSYPGYDEADTNKKIEHALTDAGPRTCHGIRYDLNANEHCQACQHWGKIKSPIVLGMTKSTPLDPFGIPGVAPISNGITHTAPSWRKQRDPAEDTDWYKEEVEPYRNKKDIIEANDTTICAFLRNHPAWMGKLWWDDMGNKPMFEDKELSDYLITKIGADFGKRHLLPIRTDRTLARCLATCCYEHRRDPLQEYLDAIPGWDGVPRLESWYIDCAGAVNTAYNRFISRMLPVSMIARAYEPGCLYRNVIVFEGPEEYRKSSFVSALVPKKQWHLSLTASFESKDVPMLIQGIWIAELTELDSMSRTTETRLKSFISDTEDAYVPKWSLFRIAPRRRTIFIGTTNDSDWIDSATGGTRWWPAPVYHPIDVETFVAIREQLYAEAKIWHGDHKHNWWEVPGDVQGQARQERDQRRRASVYESDLDVWLTVGRFEYAKEREKRAASIDPFEHTRPFPFIEPVIHETSWQEIASGFLRLDTPEKWKDVGLQKQISKALKTLGWKQKPLKRQGKTIRGWLYEPPNPF